MRYKLLIVTGKPLKRAIKNGDLVETITGKLRVAHEVDSKTKAKFPYWSDKTTCNLVELILVDRLGEKRKGDLIYDSQANYVLTTSITQWAMEDSAYRVVASTLNRAKAVQIPIEVVKSIVLYYSLNGRLPDVNQKTLSLKGDVTIEPDTRHVIDKEAEFFIQKKLGTNYPPEFLEVLKEFVESDVVLKRYGIEDNFENTVKVDGYTEKEVESLCREAMDLNNRAFDKKMKDRAFEIWFNKKRKK